MLAVSRLAMVAAAALSLALSGCSTPDAAAGPEVGDCVVPLMQVSPAVVQPGDTIAVHSDDACDVRIPDDGWVFGAGHVGGGRTVVRVTSAEALDGSLRIEIELPEDFPIGEAYAGIENWDYSSCVDTRSTTAGSCAGPIGSFTVKP